MGNDSDDSASLISLETSTQVRQQLKKDTEPSCLFVCFCNRKQASKQAMQRFQRQHPRLTWGHISCWLSYRW